MGLNRLKTTDEPEDWAVSACRRLLKDGTLKPRAMFAALMARTHFGVPLGDTFVSLGAVAPDLLIKEQSRALGLRHVNLEDGHLDAAQDIILPPDFCLRYNVLAWRFPDRPLTIVTGRPDNIAAIQAALPLQGEGMELALAPPQDVEDRIVAHQKIRLTKQAEERVDPDFSFRTQSAPRSLFFNGMLLALVSLIAALIYAPMVILAVLTIISLGAICLYGVLKAMAAAQQLLTSPRDPTPAEPPAAPPVISVLVPLFKEHEISQALLKRLERLTYPRALLDVILVLEAGDTVTRETLSKAEIPPWMRIISVPEGSGLTTKPRALNYALDFCRGEIIGIWDAEDAPERNQLEQVAAHFASAPADVACVQGILDYYNTQTNWVSRCFTIEYSCWFRVILPGLSALGFVIPLGGTTLFLRREVIEKLGGWDAHNVTEDADLGVRIARFGYRTELLNSTTREEANHRVWPWIRQRSRWLKGYMATYIVHMRRPRRLLSDLGPWRFFGLQIMFAASVLQFLLAPLLWVLLLNRLGLHYPLGETVGATGAFWIGVVLIGVGALDLTLGLVAAHRQGTRRLWLWVPAMAFYYMMATVAAYKALWELLTRPTFWDKTAHGITPEGQSNVSL